MATSRRGTPAAPTLGSTTDQASRGGLFAGTQTNTGTLESNVVVNDSTITVRINDQIQTFTVNQAMDSTLTFTVDEGGGGSSEPDPNAFSGARINGNELVLVRNSLQEQTLILPESTMVDLLPLMNRVTALEDAQYVRSATINGSIVFNPNDAGQLDLTVDTGDTVVFSNAQLSPNVQLARSVTVNGTQWRLDAGTPGTPPVTPMADGSITPTEENIFTAPVAPVQTTTITDGTTDADSVTTTVTTTPPGQDPDPPVTLPPSTVTVGGGGTEVVVTVPADNIDDEGTHTVTTTITVQPSDGGPTTMVTETDVVERFVPFFQSRSDITTEAELTAATASEMAWNGMLTAIPGTGTLYFATTELAATTGRVFAQTDTGFPVRYASLRTVSATDSTGTERNFVVFRIPINGGVTATFS